MSLDPVFVPEFANAGWLAPFEGEQADQVLDDDVLKGAAETVQWDDKVVAAPQWANTQVLWYRRSLAEAAGLDMTQPVTWDQVIEAAADNDGTVGVQANKYEAYVVWINALIQGAGGNILDPATVENGRDAKVTIDSDGRQGRGRRHPEARRLPGRAAGLHHLQRGHEPRPMFPADGAGEFMTNWTFVYKNYEGLIGKPGGPDRRGGLRGPRLGALPRRPSRARSPSPRSAASTSASAPTPRTSTSPRRRPSA